MNWMKSSATIYSTLLYLYPATVRRNDGAAMMQVFRDLAREELRMGITGLVRLWIRTGIDLVKSLPQSYLRTSLEPAGRSARRLVMIYMSCVLAFVAYGAIRYQEYYARPFVEWNGDRRAVTTVSEDQILRQWDAVAPRYSRYVRYWQVGGVAITILLGVTAAFVARWQKSIGHGLVALGAGWVATAAALHLMPFVYFPFDQYPVGFLWMFQLPIAVVCFLVALFVFRSTFFVATARSL
jgi:hypothetical protein